MSETVTSPANAPTEREKFEFEKLKFEAEQALKLTAQKQETAGRNIEIWRSPLTLAVIGGIVSLIASILSETMKSQYTIALEREKFQADLVKKYLESPDAETRKGNLKFLSEAGLIPIYSQNILTYIASDQNAVPQAPPSVASSASNVGSFGADNRIEGIALERLIDARDAMLSVQLREGTRSSFCTGFLISDRLAVTADFCVSGSLEPGAGKLADIKISGKAIDDAPISAQSVEVADGIAVIALSRYVSSAKPLTVAQRAPRVGERLMLVYNGPDGGYVASLDEECKISAVTDKDIAYRCDAEGGSAGGAVISAETGSVVAIHSRHEGEARYGTRADNRPALLNLSASR